MQSSSLLDTRLNQGIERRPHLPSPVIIIVSIQDAPGTREDLAAGDLDELSDEVFGGERKAGLDAGLEFELIFGSQETALGFAGGIISSNEPFVVPEQRCR